MSNLFVLVAALCLVSIQQAETSAPVRQKSENETPRELPKRLTLGSGQLRHPSIGRCVAFSPDGKYLASAGGAQAARLWDPNTGQLIREIKYTEGLSPQSKALAFSPNSRFLYIDGHDGKLSKLDVERGEVIYAASTGVVYALAASADGEQVVTAGRDGVVRLHNAETGAEIRNWNLGGRVMTVAMSPDGALVVAGSNNGTIALWHADEDNRLHLFLPKVSEAAAKRGELGRSYVYSTTFIGDGTRLLTRSKVHGVADNHWTATELWNVQTGDVEQTIEIDRSGEGGAVAVTPDEQKLVFQTADSVRIFDRQTKSYSKPLEHSNRTRTSPPASALSVSPNGKRLAAVGAGFDSSSSGMDIRIWSLESGEQLFEDTRRHHTYIRVLDVSQDGKLALTASDQRINLWDSTTGELRRSIEFARRYEGAVTAACFTPDSSSVLAAGRYAQDGEVESLGIIKCWDVATGELKYEQSELFGEKLLLPPFNGLAISPDGRFGVIELEVEVDQQGNKIAFFRADNGAMMSAADLPYPCSDGWHFVSDTTLELAVRFWSNLISIDARTARTFGQVHMRDPARFRHFLFSKHPEIGVTWHDRGVVVINPQTQRIVRVLSRNRLHLTCPALSEDGTRFAACEDDRIYVWDVATGKKLQELRIPEFGATAMTYFPDGKRLLVSLNDASGVIIPVE